MPSLLTARSGSNGSSSTFSRVNSLKRDWGDEDETPKQDDRKGRSSGVFDWSPSPSPERKMPKVEQIKAKPFVPAALETAADRRRKAILAAMEPNTSPSTSASASASTSKSREATPTTISTSTFYPPAPTIPSAQKAPPTQELPSIPTKQASKSTIDGKKRAYPWQEDITTAKMALARSESATSGSSSRRANSASSSGPTMSIKQKVVLSTEQQKVLNLVVGEGKNIFFTGSAGTGKSVLLREIIKNLRKKFASAPDAVAVTASTGIAACNIGGVTLHSFGGAGIAIEEVPVLVGKIKRNKKAAARWVRTKVLIIDEISMVDGKLFDKLCKIGQTLRKNQRPFGGIQIIVTGDFFQLPPVTKGGGLPNFCFEAQMWNETISMSINLTKVFRQKDQNFIDMLNEMRFGRLTPASIKKFRELSRDIKYDDGLEATELFPRREDVDKANGARLKTLNTDGWSYAATDGGAITDPVQREKILSNFLAPPHISLQIDAQVMLIKNTDDTLVNGSMGKVVGFAHKMEFETDPQGRWLPDKGWDQLDVEEREKKEAALRIALQKLGERAVPLPVVQFKVPGGGMRDVLVDFDHFKTELPNGEIQASRTQLPLILAWAMSIHKSQGQTLERVKVDLGKVFEKGQAYVALSRATSLEGLQVMNFSADKVMAHAKVARWSQSLRNLE